MGKKKKQIQFHKELGKAVKAKAMSVLHMEDMED
jgi:hypothetical protein